MIPSELLKIGVDHVYKTALVKSPLNILTHIRIKADASTGLTVFACDCDVETKINFDGSFDEIDVAIPATKLRSALSLMSGDLKVKVGSVFSMSGIKGSARLPFLPGRDMPSIAIPAEVLVTLPCKEIFDAMKSVAWLCNPRSVRQTFSDIQMRCDGEILTVFACDGVALAAYDFEVDCAPFAVLIRSEFLSKVDEHDEIHILDKFIKFSSERRSTVMKLSEGMPIDFSTIEKPFIGEITFARKDMESIIAGVANLYDINKDSKLAKWVLIDNQDKISVSANQNGFGGDFTVDGQGDPIKCALQIISLQNTLSRMAGNFATMRWSEGFPNTGGAPAVFKEGNFKSFIAATKI